MTGPAAMRVPVPKLGAGIQVADSTAKYLPFNRETLRLPARDLLAGRQVLRNGLVSLRLGGASWYWLASNVCRWLSNSSPSRRSAKLSRSRSDTPMDSKCARQVLTTPMTWTICAAAWAGVSPNASHWDIALASVESCPSVPQMNS